MNNLRLNFAIAVVLLLLLAGAASTGLTMEFVLPRGSGGSGLSLLGMTRHGWADLHFWLVTTLLVVMALHLFLHWRWIWRSVAPITASSRRIRVALFAAFVVAIGIMVAMPFLLPVTHGSSSEGGYGRGRAELGASADPDGVGHGGGRRQGRGSRGAQDD